MSTGCGDYGLSLEGLATDGAVDGVGNAVSSTGGSGDSAYILMLASIDDVAQRQGGGGGKAPSSYTIIPAVVCSLPMFEMSPLRQTVRPSSRGLK